MATLGFLQTLVLCFIITTVVSLQPIVSVDEIVDGGTFSVTCDASRVGNIPSHVTEFTGLTIYRQTSQDTRGEMLAGSIHIRNDLYKEIPPDREWTVEFTGFNNGTNNRDTMKLVLHVQVKDAVCQDAGLYECHVWYHIGASGSTSVSRRQCVTSKSCVSLQTTQEGVVPVVSQQPIVSVDEIVDGGTFSVTCDVSRLTNFPSDVTDIYRLTISRQTFRDSKNLALYDPTWKKEERIPPGRQWTVEFTGANNGTNNRNTMKIVIQVNDAVYQDAGVYGCHVVYQPTDSTRSAYMSRQQSVTSKLGSLQPIVSVDEIEDGGTFSVTCDVSRVGSLSSGVTDITQLNIYRQTSQDAKLKFLAYYSSSGYTAKIIPPGREWTVEGTGYNNGTNNRNTIKLVLQVKDAVCQDVGVYFCKVWYYTGFSTGDETSVTRPQCVTSKCKSGAVIVGSISGFILMIIAVVVVI